MTIPEPFTLVDALAYGPRELKNAEYVANLIAKVDDE